MGDQTLLGILEWKITAGIRFLAVFRGAASLMMNDMLRGRSFELRPWTTPGEAR